MQHVRREMAGIVVCGPLVGSVRKDSAEMCRECSFEVFLLDCSHSTFRFSLLLQTSHGRLSTLFNNFTRHN